MKTIKRIAAAMIGLSQAVLAYTNATKTEAYLLLTNNDPIHAFTSYHTNAIGDWFFMFLAIVPYFGMYVTQRSLHIPSIWMICCLAAYNFLIPDIPPLVFYLVGVVWLATLLFRLISPINTR